MTIDYEKEYDNRGRVKEHPEFFARWEREATAYRDEMKAKGAQFNVPFGPTPRQTYDYFPGNDPHANAPLVVFIHGGYWRSLAKENFSHMARGLNRRGINVALTGYDLCPNVSVAAIIDQTRAAMIALWHKHKKRMLVTGHSAGGHLAACMAATEWHAISREPPTDLTPFGYAISGVFDLEPMLHVSQNADLRLDAQGARAVSPVGWPLPPQRSLDAVVGGDESSEFIRQSKVIADDWAKKGAVTRYEEVPGANHYSMIDPLTDPDSAMTERVVRLAGRVNAMALSA